MQMNNIPNAETVVHNSAPKPHLLAWNTPNNASEPLITVAIPHYKHRHYLEVVLKSIFEQQFDDFEILVSSDCSPDDSDEVIPGVLKESGRRFQYYSQPHNLGYDGNVRFCLSAANGRYVFLLGNDDALASPSTLQELANQLQSLGWPQVGVTNFEDWATGSLIERALETKIVGSGVDVAVRVYRSFSFVGGLIFERAAASEHETDRWDQSVYYQIYLASRIISAGGRFATLKTVAVRKDVRLDGQTVFNYITKWQDAPWSFQSRDTGLASALRVAVDGVLPYVRDGAQSATIRKILGRALLVVYPYWILEYRQVANWSFAVGIARGLFPGILLKEYRLNLFDRIFLWAIYFLVTPVALVTPANLFSRIKAPLARVVRKTQGL